jgi:hypothetical protein
MSVLCLGFSKVVPTLLHIPRRLANQDIFFFAKALDFGKCHSALRMCGMYACPLADREEAEPSAWVLSVCMNSVGISLCGTLPCFLAAGLQNFFFKNAWIPPPTGILYSFPLFFFFPSLERHIAFYKFEYCQPKVME